MKTYLLFLIFMLSINCTLGQDLKWANNIGITQVRDYKNLKVANDSVAYFLDSYSLYKIDSTGNMIWNVHPVTAEYYTITTDKLGNVYLLGSFSGTKNFNFNGGTFNMTAISSNDMFIQKIDASGNFLWAVSYPVVYGYSSLTTDSVGNLYVAGTFYGTVDFDFGIGTYNLTSSIGSADLFVQKISPNGQHIWVSIASLPAYDVGSISTDSDGYVYLLGTSLYLEKFDALGNSIWFKELSGRLGGAFSYWDTPLSIDLSGNIFIVGYFENTVDFDRGPNNFLLTSKGYDDIFLQKIDSSGNFLWAKKLGGIYDDYISSIDIDNKGNLYMAGYIDGSVDIDPNIGVHNLIGSGWTGFVLKLDNDGYYNWSYHVRGFSAIKAFSIDLSPSQDIYVAGSFWNRVNFPNGVSINSPNLQNDFFFFKLSQDSCSDIRLVFDSVSVVTCSNLGYIEGHSIGGVTPYSYSWNTIPVIDTSFVTPDVSGIYTFSVVDSIGCASSSQILIDGPKYQNGFDLSIHLIATNFRPSLPAHVWVHPYNDGCLPTSGSFSVIIPTNVYFDSASIAPNQINGDTMTWNFNNLNPDSLVIFPQLFFRTDTFANIGDIVCFKSRITPILGDLDSSNNIREYCFPVVSSYDPNDKKIIPQGICNDKYIAIGDILTYTIRFQNTGNADAINIYIIDTLDSSLDINTLKIVGQSHPNLIVEILPGNVLKFRFDNIYLPDISNEKNSHGYVIYEVKPLLNTPDVTPIENTAHIHFDYNYPVKTNRLENTLVQNLPLNGISDTIFFTVCDSFITPNGQTFFSSGHYLNHLTSSEGCDSIVSIEYTVNNSNNSIVFETACNYYIAPDSQIYNISGQYIVRLNNSNACDSVITINLTIDSLENDSIYQVGNTLTTNINNINYQWLDCNNNLSSIPNATGQSFIPSEDGTYALQTINGTCTNISNCINFTGVRINKIENFDIVRVYPNPTSDQLNIEQKHESELLIEMYDFIGNLIYFKKLNDKLSSINLNNFPAGVYHLKIKTDNAIISHKIIKK